MTLSRRQFGTAAAGAALAMAYGKPGWAQAPIVMKFSHVVADDTPKGKGSHKFRELADGHGAFKQRIGRVHMQVHEAGAGHVAIP